MTLIQLIDAHTAMLICVGGNDTALAFGGGLCMLAALILAGCN